MQLLPARCPKTDFMRMLIRLLASYLFRVRLVGDLAPLLQAPRVLVVANHGSWLDTLLLGLLLPRQPVVVVPPDDARTPWRRRWLGLVSTTVVDVNNPVVIKRVLRLLKSGRPVVMYPEGRTNPGHGVLTGVPVGGERGGLLAYDRSAGDAAFYTVDTAGSFVAGPAYTRWRTTWEQIVAVPLAADHGALLFYDRSAGEALFYRVDGEGNLSAPAQHGNWRRTWDGIAALAPALAPAEPPAPDEPLVASVAPEG
jgi:1-acyl-sn-glycerol-3-phosphate acyltransferase